MTHDNAALALPVRASCSITSGPSPATEQDQGHVGQNDATNSQFDRLSVRFVIRITSRVCVGIQSDLPFFSESDATLTE